MLLSRARKSRETACFTAPIRSPTRSSSSEWSDTSRRIASIPNRARRKSKAHAAAMAWKLQGADPLASICVVLSLNMLDPLLDAMQVPQDEPPAPRARLFGHAELFNLHPDCLAEVTSEPPYYQELYDEARAQDAATFQLDRPRWQLALLREAEKEYSINTGEKIRSWQRRSLAKFTRNLAMLDGHLIPGVYDLTLRSARDRR